MSISETVVRQATSYRQGLVLGLTMAEVILLIVFALLIALAAVWRAEHQENLRLEAMVSQLESAHSSDPADVVLVAKFEELLRSPNRSKVETALAHIAAGQAIAALSEAEAGYVSDIKLELQSLDLPEIDQQWRELIAAAAVKSLARKLAVAEAIDRAAPGQTDANIAALIDLGRQAQQAQMQLAKEQPHKEPPPKDATHDWPPIINLHEADGYFFEKGSAELKPLFEGKLKSIIIPELVQLTQRYKVDVIEVIGHTDEQPVSGRVSNLDRTLIDAVNGTSAAASPVHADNAGLGLARAVAVVRALIRDGRLPQSQLRILPLSGGQLIATDEHITTGGGGDVPNRRRIEIRLRRSQESLGRSP